MFQHALANDWSVHGYVGDPHLFIHHNPTADVQPARIVHARGVTHSGHASAHIFSKAAWSSSHSWVATFQCLSRCGINHAIGYITQQIYLDARCLSDLRQCAVLLRKFSSCWFNMGRIGLSLFEIPSLTSIPSMTFGALPVWPRCSSLRFHHHSSVAPQTLPELYRPFKCIYINVYMHTFIYKYTCSPHIGRSTIVLVPPPPPCKFPNRISVISGPYLECF